MQVDHKDRNKKNNLIENLRIGSSYQNKGNMIAYSTTTSGFKGVHRCVRKNGTVWATELLHKRKKYRFGYYEKIEDAISAVKKGSIKLLGKFSPYFNNKNNQP